MKSPKGFGKNYFTFVAVLAYSIQTTLHALALRFDFFTKHTFCTKEEETLEDDPPLCENLLPSCIFATSRPCHCNCFFALKTKLAVALFHYIPRCPYYNTYFAFRRSGIHPPFYS